MRLVLDTNVLISGLLFPGGGPPARLVAAWRSGGFDLVVSEFLLEELARTVHHLAPRVKAPAGDLNDFLDLLRMRCEMAPLDSALLATAGRAGLRDPDDVPILATLLSAGADFIVTGDKDLLAVADAYPIMSPAAFVERFLP